MKKKLQILLLPGLPEVLFWIRFSETLFLLNPMTSYYAKVHRLLIISDPLAGKQAY